MGQKTEWFLPVSQVADLLGCDLREVQKLLATGVLSYIRMPDRKIKVSEDSVSAFMVTRSKGHFFSRAAHVFQ